MKQEIAKRIDWEEVGEKIHPEIYAGELAQIEKDMDQMIKDHLPREKEMELWEYITDLAWRTERAAYLLGFTDGGRLMNSILRD